MAMIQQDFEVRLDLSHKEVKKLYEISKQCKRDGNLFQLQISGVCLEDDRLDSKIKVFCYGFKDQIITI